MFEQLHEGLNVRLELAHFTLLRYDLLSALSFALKSLRKSLNLSILVLDKVYLLVDVHAEAVELVNVPLTLFKHLSHLDVLAALVLHKLLELGLLLSVLCEDVEILKLHALVIVCNLLNIFLCFLVLAELAHEDLVVKVELSYLITFFHILVCSLVLFLKFIDVLVSFIKLLLKHLNSFVLGGHLSH